MSSDHRCHSLDCLNLLLLPGLSCPHQWPGVTVAGVAALSSSVAASAMQPPPESHLEPIGATAAAVATMPMSAPVPQLASLATALVRVPPEPEPHLAALEECSTRPVPQRCAQQFVAAVSRSLAKSCLASRPPGTSLKCNILARTAAVASPASAAGPNAEPACSPAS